MDMESIIESLKHERDNLKLELERLSCELEQTTHEKNLSAQYGLVLLDEKQTLSQRCEELENCYDTTKAELDMLKDALAKFQTTQKVTATSGFEQEESLLLETAHKEASFTSTVLELEKELKQVRQEVARVDVEKEKILQENVTLAKSCDLNEWEKKNYKAELKELKLREAYLLGDNNELEEENISLQKQISTLRSSQVEFEGAKHEIQRLQEEIEASNAQVDELTSLKRITERQLEEALEALQLEREQKYAIKKEFDQRVNSESIFNLNNIALTGLGLGSFLQNDGSRIEEDDTEPDTPTFDSPMMNEEKGGVRKPQSSTVGDLFSELHMSELQKLEKQLEQAETEKTKLSAKLQESQQLLDKTKAELNNQSNQLNKIMDHINALNLLYSQFDEGDSDFIEDKRELSDLLLLKKVLQKHEQRYVLALQEVQQLHNEMQGLQKLNDAIVENDGNTNNKLKEDVTKLRIKICSYERRVKELEDDLKVMGEITGETRSRLNVTQNDLVSISEELAQLYHHVCIVNGETPSRIMLDHVKSRNTKPGQEISESRQPSSVPSPTDSAKPPDSKLNALKDKLKTDISFKALFEGENKTSLNTESSSCSRLIDTIHDQVSHLKRAVEHTIELNRERAQHSDEQGPSSLADVDYLQEQVIMLKSMLSTKREQIVTLRTVLNANKQTAEIALANLKSKYENDKVVVSETMMKLRNELKALKEDAATFASLRAMFAARCEEYVTQLDEMTRKYKASEEQTKALNAVLHLAIEKKVALARRVEELEIERTDKNQARRHNTHPRSYPRSGAGGGNGGSASNHSAGPSAYTSNRRGYDGSHYHHHH